MTTATTGSDIEFDAEELVALARIDRRQNRQGRALQNLNAVKPAPAAYAARTQS
jgi:hypothetical protein